MTRSRPLRALALALAALAFVACGESGSSAGPAATVGGDEIAARTLVDELDAITGNAPYVEAVEEAAAAGGSSGIFAADGDGDELDTEFVTGILGLRIQYELVLQEVGRRGLEVGGTCTDLAREQLAQRYALPDGSLGGEEVLAGFGEAYEGYLVHRHAAYLALRADLVGAACGEEVSQEAMDAYFEEHEEELTAEVACASHILVDTRDEADEIVELLAAGEDFATLATERSTDPGSAANGGALGCGPAGRYVREFDDAVFSQPVGEVGEPVETEFGFHVILVTERSRPTQEDVRGEIEQAISGEVEAAFNDWFTEALAATEVTVDARYGEWDPDTASIVRPAGSPSVVDPGEG